MRTIEASPETKRELAETFFFRPTLSVRRVITIATPFRGSEFSNATTRWLSNKMIKIPQLLLNERQELYADNPGYFREPNLLEVNTSIDSLAPDSQILPVMLEAPQAPWVHKHNIVGRLTEHPLLTHVTGDGDGVVSYSSAHLEDAESEIVVDADHSNVHRHPLAILEVHRVLLEHLREIDARPPSRLERLPWTASTTNAATPPPPARPASYPPPAAPPTATAPLP